ncbi:helix-turn-helix domain-containing protein [Pyramidobacter sp.]|uniref:helix-turn-helix domain-containing protein n=1 Tax=Pyramidobacter sp. TaxID=1943581 RepID=UPI002A76001A|nr:helix-turn-helix domain-containing protein [Pyramidobacter sp.]MCI7403545.1 helix-turn-helix domain-containing protein [Pyramidobacter sp.]
MSLESAVSALELPSIPPLRALVVEDEKLERDALVLLLHGFFPSLEIDEAGNVPEFERLARERSPDIVLLDISLPGGNGMLSLERLRRGGLGAQVVVVTAYNTLANLARALEDEVVSFLWKPVRAEALRDAVEKCVHRRETELRQTMRIKALEQGFREALKELGGHGNSLSASVKGQDDTECSPVRRAMAFIREDPGKASLEEAAKRVGVSPGHLSRLFREEGVRFMDILKDARMQRARGLLLAGASVRQAARESGYGNVAYFGLAFKKVFGVAPSALRKRPMRSKENPDS